MKVILHLLSGSCCFSIFPTARGAYTRGRSCVSITSPAPRGPGVKPSLAPLQALRVPPVKCRAGERGEICLIECLNSPGRLRPDFVPQEAMGKPTTRHVSRRLAPWFLPPHGP